MIAPRLADKREAAHPTQLAGRALGSEKPVAEFAKEDEGKLSGVEKDRDGYVTCLVSLPLHVESASGTRWPIDDAKGYSWLGSPLPWCTTAVACT